LISERKSAARCWAALDALAQGLRGLVVVFHNENYFVGAKVGRFAVT
jgi:hypothetical protein